GARAGIIVCAWGASLQTPASPAPRRVARTLALLGARRLLCLGTTQAGHPRHPLYVRGDTRPAPFRCAT
ncbi:MAG: DUF1643 domain-containing protein, partial [Phycisphaerales bacterium]